MNEFDIIERYFLPLTRGNKGVAELRDDAAVLEIPEGFELVVTSDTLNEAVHFLSGENPSNIARKALRVNLSDLAAMGADPLCYQLNIAFAHKPDAGWLSEFSKALQEDNEVFDIFCSGGDTTRSKGDFLSISITALGCVPKGEAVRRSGAKDGDAIVLTGVIGDAHLGLMALKSVLDKTLYERAIKRHRVPCPRIRSTEIVRKYANAAADISDGLLADCLHIGEASGLGVEINLENMVFSKDVQHAFDEKIIKIEDVLGGGDDYELILAVSRENLPIMIRELKKLELNPFVIGNFKGFSSSLSILGTKTFRIDDKSIGWTHF